MSAGQTQESVYDKLFHSVPARQNQENVASSSNVEIQSKNNGKEVMIQNKKRKLLQFNLAIKIFVGFIIGFIIGASISSLVLSTFLNFEANKVRRSELLLEYANMINANKTTEIIELVKGLNHMCAKTNGSNVTKPGQFKPVASCHVLSKSSPSGYYWVLFSNSSAIKVYCDMKKTCGNITGGWMRVTSLDMKQPSFMCPSSLCLDATTHRTCRRCYNDDDDDDDDDDAKKVSKEKYNVGVTYSRVCGRIIAYQVGRPDSYTSASTKGFDGIALTYGSPEYNIWSFVAALEAKYTNAKYVHESAHTHDSIILISLDELDM